MKILLIDTCGATGSIALAGATPSPAVLSLPGRSAAERLVPAIHSLAAQAGIALHSLDAIAVVHGPGSFTGVRVGLSAAKGLCHALNLPLVAISRLAVLASLAGASPAAHIRALLDAGRGEFYSCLYARDLCLRESLLTRDQLLAEQRSEEAQLIVCEPAVAQSIAELNPQLVAEPTAADAPASRPRPHPAARLRRPRNHRRQLPPPHRRRDLRQARRRCRAAASPTPPRFAIPMSVPQFHPRPAIASDLDAVLALERATALAPHWPPSAYADILESNDPGAPFIPRSLRNGWETEAQRFLIVAERNGQIAGFAVGLLHPATPDRIAELESVVVSADARRAGIGRALCRAVLDWARSKEQPKPSSKSAPRALPPSPFILALGFTLAARRPRYYRDPADDALLMRMDLQPNGGRIDD